MIIFSIPFDWTPVLIHNLKEMDWEMPAYEMGVKKFKEFEAKIIGDLVEEMENI